MVIFEVVVCIDKQLVAILFKYINILYLHEVHNGGNMLSQCLYMVSLSLDINNAECLCFDTILSMHKQQTCL